VLATLTGFGPLQPYLDDPEVEEIWINEPTKVFVARNGITEMVDLPLTDTQVLDVVERMLQSSGRRVDLTSPFVDASLPDGSRLHMVIRKPLSPGCRGFLGKCPASCLQSELQRPAA
jgi:pilus assembly protein CpaF